jgi:peptidoglycan/LPS O-acetylase OafA/YrhL
MLLCFACALLMAVGYYEDFAGANFLITLPAVTVASIALIVSALGMKMTSRYTPLVRTFVYLGRISCGLYVFHWMFIVILDVPSAHEPLVAWAES